MKLKVLSVADPHRIFFRLLSSTARLLDWLSFKYKVLFCVSAGNIEADLTLGIEGDAFAALDDNEKIVHTLRAINQTKRNRRIFSPSEAINVITVGALHNDMSPVSPLGNRIDLLPSNELPSPISSLGHGFHSSIKPDILFPGGKQLYTHNGGGVYGINISPQAPGQKAAGTSINPGEINRTLYLRGTSNATALASRSAGLIYDVIEELIEDENLDIHSNNIAPLLKALLVHGASWGNASNAIVDILGLTGHNKKKETSRFLGYGVPDIQKSLECTAGRATAIGFGSIVSNQRHEFKYPLPPSLSGRDVWRRLTITLAWLSPINVDNLKYRKAALSFEATGFDNMIGGARNEAHYQQVRNGTVQHEIIEGSKVVAYMPGDGDEIVIPVQCREDAGNLDVDIPYGLAVSLEVKENVEIPIYDEVRAAIEISLREQIRER